MKKSVLLLITILGVEINISAQCVDPLKCMKAYKPEKATDELFPIRRVRVALQIMMKSNGKGYKSPAYCHALINQLNWYMANNESWDTLYNLDTNHIPYYNYIKDTRIRYELSDSNIYYHTNDADYDSFYSKINIYPWDDNYNIMVTETRILFNKYTASLTDINKNKTLHIFLLDFVRSKSYGASWGGSSQAALGVSSYPNYVWIQNTDSFFINYDSIDAAKLLTHELLHAVGCTMDGEVGLSDIGNYDCPECCTDRMTRINIMDNAYDRIFLSHQFSPCQVGMMIGATYNCIVGFNNYNLYGSDFILPDWCTYHPDSTITLHNGDERTLEGERWFMGDIVIDSGAKLTIKCRVSMPPNGTITVKPGGQLIVDGGTITNICDSGMWGGIVIKGYKNLSQNYHNQGRVLIENNSVIENAKLGVWDQDGGVLQVSNSSFRNCRYGVKFYQYHNPNDSNNNMSYFREDSFICTKPMKDKATYHGQGTVDFVDLWDVMGVKFWGNTFINTCDSCSHAAYGDLHANYPCRGIEGYDASFIVDKSYSTGTIKEYIPCEPPDNKPNQFIGMHSGICIDNHFPGRQVNIYNSQFINTSLPIECHHDYGTLIYNNNFLWNIDFINDSFVQRPTGISLFNSNRFSILQDTMKWSFVPDFNGSNYMNGIYAENTCNDSNESDIYKNMFDALNGGSYPYIWGNFFVKNNPKIRLNCNSYSNMMLDWYILNDSTTFSDQYGSDQTFDAGNNFSNNGKNFFNILNCWKYSCINHFNYYFSLNPKLLKVDHVSILNPPNTNPCDNISLCSIYPPHLNPPRCVKNIDSIFKLISQNDILDANNLTNNLPQITTEQVHTYNFLHIILQVLSDNRTYWQLTQTEKNSIYTIALADDVAGDYARGFLDFFCDYTFNQKYYAITDTVTDSSIYNRNKVHVDLSPNPSISNITLTFSPEIKAFDNYTVTIYDNNQTQKYSHTYPGNDTIITILRDSIGCPGTYRCVVILNNIIDTNIAFVLLPRKVHVDLYPNPSNANISLALSSEIHDYSNYTVSIYDATQYQRYSCTYPSYDTVITIPRSSIGYAGTYSCKITLNSNVDTNITFVLSDSIEVSIYPNPTLGSITISLTGISGYSSYTVLIYDQYNNLKYQHTYNSSDNPIQVSGSYMGTAGIYTVAIIQNNTVVYATFLFEVSN